MPQESLEDMVSDMGQGVVDDLIAKYIPRDAYPEAWDIEGLMQSVPAAFARWPKRSSLSERCKLGRREPRS